MYLVHDPSHCPSLSDSEFVLKLRLSSTNTGHTLATGIVCIGAVDASHPAWIVLYFVRSATCGPEYFIVFLASVPPHNPQEGAILSVYAWLSQASLL